MPKKKTINRLKHFRHKLEMERIEFAELIEVDYNLYTRYEKHDKQPERDSLYHIYLRLKTRIPDLHMEDLLE